jgi:hypothetical protein
MYDFRTTLGSGIVTLPWMNLLSQPSDHPAPHRQVLGPKTKYLTLSIASSSNHTASRYGPKLFIVRWATPLDLPGLNDFLNQI